MAIGSITFMLWHGKTMSARWC